MKTKSLAWTEFLVKNNLTQREVAAFLCVSTPTVSHYVSGLYKPKKTQMDKIFGRTDWDTSMFNGEWAKAKTPDEKDLIIDGLRKKVEKAEALCEEYLAIIKALTKTK